jgi:hypothetical protein
MISSKSHGAAKRRRSQGLCLPESAVPARRLLPNRREACQSWPLGRVRREDVAAPTASTSAASASAAATTAAEQLPSVLPHGLHPATAARPGLRRHPAPQLHRSPRRSRPRSSPVRRRHEWRRLRGVIRRRGAGPLWDELPEPGAPQRYALRRIRLQPGVSALSVAPRQERRRPPPSRRLARPPARRSFVASRRSLPAPCPARLCSRRAAHGRLSRWRRRR